MERMPGHVAQILYKDTKRLAHLLHWIQTFYLTFPKETIFKPPKAPESFGKTYFQMKVNKLGRCLVPGRIPLGGIFAATARLGARLSCYLHILFTSHTWQNSHVGALRLWKNLCSWKNHKQKKVFVKKQAQIRKDKISAQPYTTLCIQFLDRENKNNTLPLGKKICFTKVWDCAEILPKKKYHSVKNRKKSLVKVTRLAELHASVQISNKKVAAKPKFVIH